MQWDSLEDSSLKFTGSPENEAFAQGMRLYQQTEGKRVGLHYLLPCTSRTLRHMHSCNSKWICSHERFSRVLAQRLVCATTFYTQTNGRYAPDRKQVPGCQRTQNSLTALILAMKSYYIPGCTRSCSILIMSPWKVL
jgi:hypothetical protein